RRGPGTPHPRVGDRRGPRGRGSKAGRGESGSADAGVARPALAGQLQEVLHDLGTLGREDRLRMELHAEPGKLAMADPHDEVVVGPGDDLEILGQPVAFDHQRVVPAALERVRYALEDPLAGVVDR